MSTNIRIKRICDFCLQEFTAKTTKTKYCSHKCNSRAYKAAVRKEKVEISNIETIKVINADLEKIKLREFLNITQASTLFGISRRTIYRLIDRGYLNIAKFGTRTVIKKCDLEGFFAIPIIEQTLQPVQAFQGRQSLYLDFYPEVFNPETGKKTRREFLNLYIFDKPKGFGEKLANSENMRTAELICTRRRNEVNKEFIYTPFELEQMRLKEIGQRPFLQYFKKQGDKRVGRNWDIWDTAICHFENFTGGRIITFQDITISFIDDYREYLLNAKNRRNTGNKIARNTALSYFNKLKTTLKKAYKEGLLQFDVNAGIEGIKEQESQRNYLTMEEAISLFRTPFNKEVVKRVSLFSILTVLRYSDIAKLRWKEVQHTLNDGYYIRFAQQKTEKQENLPISEQAYDILGKRGEQEQQVFPGLKKWDFDRLVPLWVKAAGINKQITFHCFRHTYATLQIAEGTDLLTVSKMLGHKSVKTTQIYTKVVDQRKREAADRLKLS